MQVLAVPNLGLAMCRHNALQHFIHQWGTILMIQDAFGELADANCEGVLRRRAGRFLAWWHEWVIGQQDKRDTMEAVCAHMDAGIRERSEPGYKYFAWHTWNTSLMAVPLSALCNIWQSALGVRHDV